MRQRLHTDDPSGNKEPLFCFSFVHLPFVYVSIASLYQNIAKNVLNSKWKQTLDLKCFINIDKLCTYCMSIK